MDFENMLRWNEPMPQVGQGVRKIKTRFQPTGWFSGGAAAQPNQYIRWNFQTNGLWDPQSVYIYIEMNCLQAGQDVIYQIDNSAQSFIGQYVSRVNGVELERLQEYDEIASVLYDMNIGVNQRDAKTTEGVGKNRYVTNNFSNRMDSGAGYKYQCNNTGAINYLPANGRYSSDGTDVIQPLAVAKASENAFTPTTSSFRPYLGVKTLIATGDIGTISTGYAYEGSTVSGARLSIPYILDYKDQFCMNDVEGCSTYWIDNQQSINYQENYGWFWASTYQLGITRPNTETSVGTGEPWFSTTFPKYTIKSGCPTADTMAYGNFCIPLLSTLFGPLATHGKLLPMKIFEGLEFEFLLSPYAFFSSVGSNNPSKHNSAYVSSNMGYGNTGSTIANSRTNWTITKMEIVVDIYYMDKAVEDTYMNRLQQEGFKLDIKQWYLGPKIKYGNTSSLNQTIQINNGFNSLNAIAFYFQPCDYETYPFCRKHKRISGNLTSMQLRIGNEYFPSLPVVGHAGNIRPDYTSASNKGNFVEFYVNTMQSFGKFFNMNEDTLINSSNFTLNTTGYNPLELGGPFTIQAHPTTWSGMTNFWENSIVPRCIFALDLEKLDLTGNIRSGWDTTKYRPFDLLLQNDSSSMNCNVGAYGAKLGGLNQISIGDTSFNRPVYLYIWMLYDSRISWTADGGWNSEGRV